MTNKLLPTTNNGVTKVLTHLPFLAAIQSCVCTSISASGGVVASVHHLHTLGVLQILHCQRVELLRRREEIFES